MTIKDFFKENSRIAVAFSGGVDSSVLLLLAKKYADSVRAYYVKSQFQPQFEYDDAVKVAEQTGVEMTVLNVDVLQDEKVCANPADRCYYCKKKIFNAICSAAKRDGFDVVADGTNASDDIADRPGFRALGELNVLSPLKECGITKKQIRQIAAENGITVADKPSYACLATRVPTGTKITAEILEKTEEAEKTMFALGFKNFRVRCNGGAAKLEFGNKDMILFNEKKDAVISALSKYYDEVILDPKVRIDE